MYTRANLSLFTYRRSSSSFELLSFDLLLFFCKTMLFLSSSSLLLSFLAFKISSFSSLLLLTEKLKLMFASHCSICWLVLTKTESLH